MATCHSAVSLLQLPDPCLLAVLCCCDHRSVGRVACAHSRLHQTAATSGLLWADSKMPALRRQILGPTSSLLDPMKSKYRKLDQADKNALSIHANKLGKALKALEHAPVLNSRQMVALREALDKAQQVMQSRMQGWQASLETEQAEFEARMITVVEACTVPLGLKQDCEGPEDMARRAEEIKQHLICLLDASNVRQEFAASVRSAREKIESTIKPGLRAMLGTAYEDALEKCGSNDG